MVAVVPLNVSPQTLCFNFLTFLSVENNIRGQQLGKEKRIYSWKMGIGFISGQSQRLCFQIFPKMYDKWCIIKDIGFQAAKRSFLMHFTQTAFKT